MTIAQALQQAWKSVQEKDLPAATLRFQHALALQPQNLEALAGLGQALCWQRRMNEGLGHLRQAAQVLEKQKRGPQDLRFIVELAAQLHHWGDLSTALQLTHLALSIDPACPAALHSHAQYLARMNRADQALEFAQKASRIMPLEAAFSISVASIEAQLGQHQSARLRLENILEAAPNSPHAFQAHQQLVGVLDHLGCYDEAFSHCLKAKELYHQWPSVAPIEKQSVFRTIERNKQGYPASLLQRWSPADLADSCPTPVFLMGFLRSGTTLTEQILAAHPAVVSSDENNLISELTQKVAELTGCPEDHTAQGVAQLNIEQVRQLRQFYWQRIAVEYRHFDPTHHTFLNKVALNSIEIGFIATLFPEARIIFALRDPRDVCLSCFQQTFQPSVSTVNLATWEKVAHQYAAVMDLWFTIQPIMQPRFLELRYEDTVHDLQGSMQKVFALLALPWSDSVHQYHELAKERYIATPSFSDVTKPLYQRSVARWRHYEKHFLPLQEVLAPYLERFGDTQGPHEGLPCESSMNSQEL